MGIGPGHLPTASASLAARRVSCVITKNRNVIIDGLQLVSCQCHVTVHAIIFEDLKTQKVCADWVSRDVTPEQKERRVHNCQELLAFHSNDQTDSLPD